jgi:phosphoesterase RecJ-like protein
MGKKARIVNSSPIPENYRFIQTDAIETWRGISTALPKDSALLILDTADEYNIGELRDIIPYVDEVFVIDHHEINPFSNLKGYIDSTASSVSEMAVELAEAASIKLEPEYAKAVYAGIAYDTGFFAYPKTTSRTFKAALSLVNAGVNPYEMYKALSENISNKTLYLHQNVFASLEFHDKGRVAIQTLRQSDLEETGANFEDTDNFINIPMKSREIEVSVFVKQNKDGQVRCSLRSKGKVNVSKLAQTMGGGGHLTAAGFISKLGIDETREKILGKVSSVLEEK